jgi:hypothetical protein
MATGSLFKLAFGGTLAQTESWTCGVNTWDAAIGGGTFDEGLMAAAISQWMTRLTSNINPLAQLEWFKYNEIDSGPIGPGLPGGKYVDQANAHTYFYPAPVAGAAPNRGIPQATIAVSTVTAAARGRGSKGRFFPPTAVDQSEMGIDGRLGNTRVQQLATSAAQLLTDVNGANSGSCVVYSFIGQTYHEITGVRVGSVTDTQRRRRRNLIEVYQSSLIS